MTMQDPIADMFTRIRNAQAAKKVSVMIPLSKLKVEIAKVLADEGYIEGFSKAKDANDKPALSIDLKYNGGIPVIQKIQRVSRPGLRIYRGTAEMPSILGGLGMAIVSTTKGVMSAQKAKALNCGGELLCIIE